MFDRLKKTSLALNESAQSAILERFSIKGVNLDNIEQLYNPLNSGFSKLHETRTHLIRQGMTAELADNLARRYINRLESSGGHICSIMDFFNSTSTNATSLNALLNAAPKNIHFAYQSWEGYLQGLAEKEVINKLQATMPNYKGLDFQFQRVRPVHP